MNQVKGVLVAVDPGIRASAWSAWNENTFIAAGYARGLKEGQMLHAVGAVARELEREVTLIAGVSLDAASVAVEWPQIYRVDHKREAQRKADPNDLLPLAAIAGAIAARALDPFAVRPAEWKGQLDKDKTEARARARLSPEELERATQHVERAAPPSLQHNVWDAIGIGLWALGRFERKRVFAR